MIQLTRHEQWSSRAGFILAAVGAAVGLGNIWKFPYVTGTNGGGAFVIVYLIAVVLVGMPILMAELMLGRRGHQSPPTAMLINAEKEGRTVWWSGIGWIGTIVGFLILSFYSVIGGWVLDYLFISITDGFAGITPTRAQEQFNQLLYSPLRLTLWFSVFLGITVFIVSIGLQKGIERVSSVLMPTLFFLLLVLVIYSAMIGDFMAGLKFLFDADFSKINANVVLMATGQAFFSIGVSMGLMMAYGAYLPQDVSIPRTAMIIVGADTLVALMAGLAIFPLVFGNGLTPAEGPGLIFVTLPIAFGNIAAGSFFAAVFFLLLLFAAVTSSIGILEPAVAWVEEHRGINRRLGAALVGSVAWLIGINSVLSFNIWADVKPIAGKTFFELMDYLTANLMMPIGGMLIAIFAGWFMRRDTLLQELALQDNMAFKAWHLLIRTIVPLAIAGILVSNYL
jgi:neurotransmitter:Na+ symporter, NSS family